MTKPTPPVLARPKLAQWMFDRNIRPAAAAEHLNVSDKQVRRYCLPFGDARRQVPGEDVLRAIVRWTAGEVTVADFYPPELSGRAGDADELVDGGAE